MKAIGFSLVLLLLSIACAVPEEPGVPTPERDAPAPPIATGTATGGKPDTGRWRPVRQSRVAEEMARLEAIGYVGGSRDTVAETGVTIHRSGRAGAGHNLYLSGHAPEAILIDMGGRELHRWCFSCMEIWPEQVTQYRPHQETRRTDGRKKFAQAGQDTDFFRNARLLPDGSLLAIFEGKGLIKLDRDSNLVWSSRCGAHHDLDLLDNGDILVLTREARINPLVSEEWPILEDFICTLDGADGRVKTRVSLLTCFANSQQPESIWRTSKNRTGDIFHTNTLAVLAEPPPGAPEVFAAGRVLTAMRMLHCVAVVDLEAEQVVWARTGGFRALHDPRLLPNGNLLLFDNLGAAERSRVLEFDLHTWRPVWSYVGDKAHPFFSETCGTAQRLANGNTLVTESDGGRAFEIDPLGEIVWEFWNPHRAGDRDQFIAALFTVRRLEPGFPLEWLPAS